MNGEQIQTEMNSGGIDPSPGNGISVEGCLSVLSPVMRADYEAVEVEGISPSTQAERRSVYPSTVCENVRRAAENIREAIKEKTAYGTGNGYEIEVHTVGGKEPDGSPAAIGKWTFQTKIVRDVVEDAVGGRVLNATAGQTRLTNGGGETVRNDINPDVEADYHKDICDLGDEPFGGQQFDSCILDPPFDMSNSEKHYEGWHASDLSAARENLSEIIRPGGVLVECGWNSHGVGIADDGWDREALHIFYRGPCLPDMFLTVDRKMQVSLV